MPEETAAEFSGSCRAIFEHNHAVGTYLLHPEVVSTIVDSVGNDWVLPGAGWKFWMYRWLCLSRSPALTVADMIFIFISPFVAGNWVSIMCSILSFFVLQ